MASKRVAGDTIIAFGRRYIIKDVYVDTARNIDEWRHLLKDKTYKVIVDKTVAPLKGKSGVKYYRFLVIKPK